MNGRQREGNTVPSNYIALPVAERRGAKTVDRDRYAPGQLTVRLSFTITSQAAVHVGAGYVDRLDGGKLFLEVMTARDGSPCLPATGIKGAVRSIFESLTGGCELSCKPDRQVCAACALFGCLGAQGRVCFDEALPTKAVDFGVATLPTPYAPSSSKGRRFYGKAPAGAPLKTSYGVITPGATFRSAVLVEHATEAELGALFLSLGLDGTFFPRIGGGKHGGLGAVRFTPTALRLLDPATRYRGASASAQPEPVAWVKRLCEAAERSLSEQGKNNLEALRKHLAL